MNFILLAVIAISLYGATFKLGGQEAYLSKPQTSAINGVFVMFVFLSHFRQYVEIGNYDYLYSMIVTYLGQLMVTTFLFYSGYGVALSLKEKENYGRKLPKRLFTVWKQFAIAVCLYLVLDIILGNRYTITEIILSFTAWESIGNSNWYIFAILSLYIFTYIGYVIARDRMNTIVAIVCAGCVVYVLGVHMADKGSWFYDTILCYPMGMFYAINREHIDDFIFSKKHRSLVVCAFFFSLFCASYILSMFWSGLLGVLMVEVRNVLFVLTIVFATTSIKIGNRILDWLGQYVFEIYILQRLPMIALQNMDNKYFYFTLCLTITLLISVAFKYLLRYCGNVNKS